MFFQTIFTKSLIEFLDFQNYWSSSKGHSIQIESVPKGQPKIAKNLLLQVLSSGCDNESLSSQQLKDVDRLLKLELKNLSFTLDSLVYFDFFNKKLTLKIIYWSAVPDSFDNGDPSVALEESLDKLNLNKHTNSEVFTVTNSTSVEVSSENIPSSDEENDDKTLSKYLITKKDVGGLDKQLEIIEEIIDFALGLRNVPEGNYNTGVISNLRYISSYFIIILITLYLFYIRI